MNGHESALEQLYIWNYGGAYLRTNDSEFEDKTYGYGSFLKNLKGAAETYKGAKNGKVTNAETPEKAVLKNEKYQIKDISLGFDNLGTEGKIVGITVSGDNKEGEKIETTVNNRINGESISTVKSNTNFGIEISKDKFKGVKEVTVTINLEGTNYNGDYQRYNATVYAYKMAEKDEEDEWGDFKDIEEKEMKSEDGQNLIHVNVNPGTVKWTYTFTVKLGEPELVTTKYIKSIKHADGSIYYVDERPTVEVDLNIDVNKNGRYNLTKQDTSNLNVTYEDQITYAIRVYNVGSLEADMSDTDLKSKDGVDGNKVISDGLVYDYYSDNLEYVSGNADWRKEDNSNHYVCSAEKLGIITSYEEYLEENGLTSTDDDGSGYSEEVEITFKVVGEVAQSNVTIKNNKNKVTRDDKNTVVKFLYKAKTKDAEGNEFETSFAEPEVKIYTDKSVGDPDRVKITNQNAPDLTVMDGDTLVYCIRYYSIGENTTCINYDVKDTFGTGLEFNGAKDENGKAIQCELSTNKVTIKVRKTFLDGYNGGEPPHYDVYLTFKVNTSEEYLMKKSGQSYVSSIKNEVTKNTVPVAGGYNIKGKVFIDQLNETEGKVTTSGNAICDSNDRLVEGIKVELLEEDGETPAEIKNPATGVAYPNTVYTDENGEYEFKYLRVSKIEIDSETGEIEGKESDYNKYIVRFTYNGQEYENVMYAAEKSKEASYSTEYDSERVKFNNQFTTIDEKNSTEYTLMNEVNRQVTPVAIEDFEINSYSGKGDIEGRKVEPNTEYREYLNLGLVKREFDLSLENRLDSMDVSINGVSQQFTSFNGGTISETVSEQDVYFKESDYKAAYAINESNSNQITSTEKELSVWVNYTVTVKNESKLDFVGILNRLDFYCDGRFDRLEVDGKEYNIISGNQGFSSKIGIPIQGKELHNTAGNNTQEIKISLHLSREKIAEVIENENVFKTLETIAEIGSYSTKYGGDIYGNGHGAGNPNAGKIDEDSNAGNFELNEYLKIRTSAKPKEILAMFNKEDDCKRSLGIKLMKDSNKRTLSGRVFEDATTHKEADNTRFGDGEYKEDKDKTIKNVTVELIEVEDNSTEGTTVKVLDSEIWREAKVTTDSEGKYTITGYIPSKNYKIRFTYGDGKTSLYNAQDYKSTIDTTKEDYKPATDVNSNSPNGDTNYWYTHTTINNKSVAKDDDTKMISKEIDNATALKLENYQNVENDKNIFKNTATTAKFYAPIRWTGNTGTEEDRAYGISGGIQNMNLGLAERPRSELTINKIVDHINITTADGRVLIDGNQGAINSTSWTDRYVQAIMDENLIYGSTLKITYKYFITNTGEVDYMSSGKVEWNTDGTINKENNNRKYYDYGTIGSGQSKVTTQAKTIIDYVDNGLRYDNSMLANPETDSTTTNSTYWTEIKENTLDESTKELLDESTKEYYKTINTKLILKDDQNNKLYKELTAGESGDATYLTLSKVLSTADDASKNSLVYNNYIEIIKQTNSAGRRSYHTTENPNKEVNTADKNYTTKEKTESGKITGYTRNTEKGNSENILLSDVQNRGKFDENGNVENYPISNSNDNNNDNDKYLVLSIPGNIGNPAETTTTLYWEPDTDQAQETQIVPPFGNQKAIWTTIATLATATLAAGIYLINKKVIQNK